MKVTKSSQDSYRSMIEFVPGDIIETSSGAVYLVTENPHCAGDTYPTVYVLIAGANDGQLTAPRLYGKPAAIRARLFTGTLTLRNGSCC